MYGEAINKEKIVVTDENTVLSENQDYLIRCSESNKTFTINVIGINDYECLSKTFEGKKEKIELDKAVIEVSDCMFSGKPCKPEVTVKLNDMHLEENTDFEVSYYNNTDVGDNTAAVIITGIGNYYGYAEKKFSITEFKPTTTSQKIYGSSKTVNIIGGYADLSNYKIKSYTVTDSDGEIVASESYKAPGASNEKVYFSKSGEYVLTFYTQNSNGIVKMVSGPNGSGYQYVYSYTGNATKYTVKVNYKTAASAPETIAPSQLTPNFKSIDYKTMLLGVNDKNYASDLDNIVWSVSDSNVAVINDNGILDLKTSGKVIVTAKINDLEAKFDLDIKPLDISGKGKIFYDDSKYLTVVYDGKTLRENIDFEKTITTKGDAKIINIKGNGLFEGELNEVYYSDTNNKYCSNKIDILSLPIKTTYRANSEDLDLKGAIIAFALNDGSKITIPITKSMISGFDETIIGGQEILVTACSARTSFKINLINYIPGDLDGVEGITDADAIYLLMHTYFPEDYPLEQPCDFNGDGAVTDADAVYLLMYTYFPEDYPIK